MKVQSCYIDGMTGLSFIHAHRHDCATTSDVQKLVVLGWSLDNPSAKALPWLWIAPSHIGQRGLFSFRSSKNMAPFLRTLAGWFDIQDDQGTQCMGQILFQPSAAQRPHFDWLIPKELAMQRARALGSLREQPTIALWWAAMVQHTPLWACTAMGWLEPGALQQNTTSFMQESMHEMMGTWIKKTQTYYGIVEQSCLSWSMPDPDESWMRMLFSLHNRFGQQFFDDGHCWTCSSQHSMEATRSRTGGHFKFSRGPALRRIWHCGNTPRFSHAHPGQSERPPKHCIAPA